MCDLNFCGIEKAKQLRWMSIGTGGVFVAAAFLISRFPVRSPASERRLHPILRRSGAPGHGGSRFPKAYRHAGALLRKSNRATHAAPSLPMNRNRPTGATTMQRGKKFLASDAGTHPKWHEHAD